MHSVIPWSVLAVIIFLLTTVVTCVGLFFLERLVREYEDRIAARPEGEERVRQALQNMTDRKSAQESLERLPHREAADAVALLQLAHLRKDLRALSTISLVATVIAALVAEI